jgi:hypothetical protein
MPAMGALPHRFQFTVRGLMLAVLLGALAMISWRGLVHVQRRLSGDPYAAVRSISKNWSLANNPSIEVDLFEGSIQVLPSGDRRTSATITVAAVSKYSQAAADEMLGAIKADLIAREDKLKITLCCTRDETSVTKAIDVKIYVPKAAKLDLQTRRGEIRVGQDYVGIATFHLPVAASSIVARNLSPRRFGYAEGNIVVEAVAPSDSPLVRLVLEAPGRIDIRAENALVFALAHGGALPVHHAAGPREQSQADREEGSIKFDGSLSIGRSSFRAAHSIDLILPRDASFHADIAAVDGRIVSQFGSQPTVAGKSESMWLEDVGLNPQSVLVVRAMNGAVTLKKTPEEVINQGQRP